MLMPHLHLSRMPSAVRHCMRCRTSPAGWRSALRGDDVMLGGWGLARHGGFGNGAVSFLLAMSTGRISVVSAGCGAADPYAQHLAAIGARWGACRTRSLRWHACRVGQVQRCDRESSGFLLPGMHVDAIVTHAQVCRSRSPHTASAAVGRRAGACGRAAGWMPDPQGKAGFTADVVTLLRDTCRSSARSAGNGSEGEVQSSPCAMATTADQLPYGTLHSLRCRLLPTRRLRLLHQLQASRAIATEAAKQPEEYRVDISSRRQAAHGDSSKMTIVRFANRCPPGVLVADHAVVAALRRRCNGTDSHCPAATCIGELASLTELTKSAGFTQKLRRTAKAIHVVCGRSLFHRHQGAPAPRVHRQSRRA